MARRGLMPATLVIVLGLALASVPAAPAPSTNGAGDPGKSSFLCGWQQWLCNGFCIRGCSRLYLPVEQCEHVHHSQYMRAFSWATYSCSHRYEWMRCVRFHQHYWSATACFEHHKNRCKM